jgi:hypothetical protein
VVVLPQAVLEIDRVADVRAVLPSGIDRGQKITEMWHDFLSFFPI